MRFYAPIAKVDAEQRMVWGYASTAALDDQGEVVTREALAAALDDYMMFANIREMHQMSAVGVAKEAGIDDKGLYVGARITDDRAWAKVQEGVYKGFSIGGRVRERSPAEYKIITALALNEISLVDRPANPEAVFDCWKAEGADTMAVTAVSRHQPMQVWDCGLPDHRHIGKTEAARCMATKAVGWVDSAKTIASARDAAAAAAEVLAKSDDTSYGAAEHADPGYQPDGKKRYPLESEKHIRAAWAYIHKPGNAVKYTPDQVDRIKQRIVAAWKARIDRDGPPLAEGKAARTATLRKSLHDVGHLAHIILDLDWLREVLAVEAAMEGDDSPQPPRLGALIDELCGVLNALVAEETAELLDGDGMPELPVPAEIVVLAAGASGAAVADILRKAGNARLEPLAAALAKLGAKHSRADQMLLDHVHECLKMLTDGACCETIKAAARHSRQTRRHLQKAHDHLCAAGARCNAYDAEAEHEGTEEDTDKAVHSEALAKALADKTALLKTLGDIVPRLDQLAKRVDDIAQVPLPPLTLARGVSGVSKREDGGGSAASSEDVVAALAKMSGEQRTIALIKAAYANPIVPPGFVSGAPIQDDPNR